MLEALDNGVKGGKWFSLIDKVKSMRNLRAAYARVAANRGAAGVDHVTIEMFGNRLGENLSELRDELFSGWYCPLPVRRVEIPKPGKRGETRPLGIPAVRDRIVQTALRNVLEPIFERHFAEHSYGFRPGRGCKDGLRRVEKLLSAGYRHVVDADLKSYFDTIPHGPLLDRIGQRVSDSRILDLVEAYLEADVMDGMSRWTPERGSPQGAVISPLLSNIYLDPLDKLMAERGFEMVRYADDFVLLCRTAEEAEAALTLVREWTDRNGLTLHPDKTRIVNVSSETFDFLGYTFGPPYGKWPRETSINKLKDTIRRTTRRCNGDSLEEVILRVNRTLRGWFEYFKHSKWYIFDRLDRWIRMRIRSILRWRQHRKGRAKGADHQRWPNAFFTEHGLFSLLAAHDSALRSARAVNH